MFGRTDAVGLGFLALTFAAIWTGSTVVLILAVAWLTVGLLVT